MSDKNPGFAFNAFGTVLGSTDPRAAGRFFVDLFDYEPVVELDWYVSLTHPSVVGHYLDVMDTTSDAYPAALAEITGAGGFIAMVVEDAAGEFRRLLAAGANVLMPMVDKPWGQRLFRIGGPDGLVIEIAQRIAPTAEWLASRDAPQE